MADIENVRVAVVVGSTRPGRRAGSVAEWFVSRARAAGGAVTYVVVDIADFRLPLLDEPQPAAIGGYANEHTIRWAEVVAGFDGFVFVVPEYNHSYPAALKNAIDYLYVEWHDKAAAFVTYGLGGGVRAAEHLRTVLAEVKVACVRSQVALTLSADFVIEDMTLPGTCAPRDVHDRILDRMLDELTEWSVALRRVRRSGPAGTR